MNNFGLLYKYELKKILKNKLTIAMLIVMVLITVTEALVPAISVGMTAYKESSEAQKTLDGRLIDDTLLEEMFPKLIENGQTWNDTNIAYSGIASIERSMLPGDNVLTEYSAEDMYKRREETMSIWMEEDRLTEGEKAWWGKEQLKIAKPFTYYNYDSALLIAQNFTGILFIIMLISTLCLSTVLNVEHRLRTDQLVLSCKNGRKVTFWAKVSVSLSLIIGCSVFSTVLLVLLISILYGLNGFNAIVQLEVANSPYPLTFGQFLLLQFAVMLTSGIMFAAFSMAISEILKNSLVVNGIVMALFVFGQLEIIPPQYRLLNQLNSLLPSNQISIWSLLEFRLYHIGGHYFTGFAVAPVIYILIAALSILAGWISYRRFQVGGR